MAGMQQVAAVYRLSITAENRVKRDRMLQSLADSLAELLEMVVTQQPFKAGMGQLDAV